MSGPVSSTASLICTCGVIYCPSDTHAAKQVDSCEYDPEPEEISRKRRRRGKKRKKKFSSPTIWTGRAKVAKVSRRFQKQKQGLCGVISVNNALGRKLLSREDVDAMVKKVVRGGDDQGNYSAEPLHMALQQKGYGLQRVRGKNHMWLASQKEGQFIVLGWHSADKPMHYIAVDASAGVVIDGAKKNMFRLDVGGILGCLRLGVYRIWQIKHD